MVWQYPSPISVGKGRGAFHLLKLFLPAFAAATGGGEGDSSQWSKQTHLWMRLQKNFILESTLFSVFDNRYKSLLKLEDGDYTLFGNYIQKY
jgi:hypothetical protein